MTLQRTLTIELPQGRYPIHIDSGFQADLLRAHVRGKKIAVVSNHTVAPLYLQTVTEALGDAPGAISHCVIDDGEQHKDFAHWREIIDHLASHRIGRDDVLLALGGGVICDITGFAAASWMRGTSVIQLPTTLLAQVDASVGGKTGINHPAGKNLIGAFHQPAAVHINIETLNTLPQREFRSGIAEVIKYGLLGDANFIDWLNARRDDIVNKTPATLAAMIERCCQHKAQVVAEDEKEHGVRALLNLGHTFGHAIETASGYTRYLHGEAVAIGMHMAAQLSERLGHAPAGLAARTQNVLQQFGLPTKLGAHESNADELLIHMRLDKKIKNNAHRLILLQAAGKAFIAESVKETDIVEAMKQCIG